MLLEPRAVLFDLDDTLYARRGFVFSGFDAVAATAAATWGADEPAVRACLADAFVTRRGEELQAVVERFGLPADALARLIDVMRTHTPALRLPRPSLDTLRAMRAGWRIGIVTNGRPDIQARKVAALGLARLVDVVVFAHATGSGVGKPAPEPFLEACMRLAVTPGRTVFVGDDPTCDVDGARRVGMKTIWIRRTPAGPPAPGDVTLRSLAGVPGAAERLLPMCWSPYAA